MSSHQRIPQQHQQEEDRNDFWKGMWNSGHRLAWQQDDVNWSLLEFGPKMFKSANRVLVPLCGDSIDMLWLYERGCKVVGVDCSAVAIERFFLQHNLQYDRKPVLASGFEEVFTSTDGGISIYIGDYFASTPTSLGGHVNAIYDRASMVALEPELMATYCQVTLGILEPLTVPKDRYLLISLNYDETKYSGPPYAVSQKALKSAMPNVQLNELHQRDVLNDHWISRGLDYFFEITFSITI